MNIVFILDFWQSIFLFFWFWLVFWLTLSSRVILKAPCFNTSYDRINTDWIVFGWWKGDFTMLYTRDFLIFPLMWNRVCTDLSFTEIVGGSCTNSTSRCILLFIQYTNSETFHIYSTITYLWMIRYFVIIPASFKSFKLHHKLFAWTYESPTGCFLKFKTKFNVCSLLHCILRYKHICH